jgi:hypothetical protein
MPQDYAYKQLLTLISARSQQWIRNQAELLPADAVTDEHIQSFSEIAVTAYICTSLRGHDAPVKTFIESRITPQFLSLFMDRFKKNGREAISGGYTFLRCIPLRDRQKLACQDLPLNALLALCDMPDQDLLDRVEAELRRPVPHEQTNERLIASYAELLALCYSFGNQRPRFSNPGVYGDAYANCLRFADWAQEKGRLLPLVQMIYCLFLIDPDFDAMPLLSDVIASQRPDGSLPERIGFGSADQDSRALRPTLGTLVALHMAIYGQRRSPGPLVTMAA